jgi:hypothetical protein
LTTGTKNGKNNSILLFQLPKVKKNLTAGKSNTVGIQENN